MNYLNAKLWGPFYTIAIVMMLYLVWGLKETRVSGIAAWIVSILVVILICFNIWILLQEIKKQKERDLELKRLSGIPVDDTKKRKLFGR
ncbi:MAG: hypothetical protein JXA44_10500 [Methanospirillaceae archaeon]|nr:hypothetical protein [Methanospirillaceae archaeon]